MPGFEIIYPIGAALLLAAIVYAYLQSRGRTSSEKRATDAATRREYKDEEEDRQSRDHLSP